MCISLLLAPAYGDDSPPDAYQHLIEAAANPQIDFFEAYEKARSAGVPDAKLVGARVLNQLTTGNLDGLLLLRPRLEQHLDDLPTGVGELFSFREEAVGLIISLRAVEAFRKEDWESFDSLAKGAYLVWPMWTKLFGIIDMAQKRRNDQLQAIRMQDLSVPMDYVLLDLDGNTAPLGQIAAGNKAVLLDFWASWCGPCIRLMPELQKKADKYSALGIVVVAVNTDESDPVNKAVKIKADHNMNLPWMLEPPERPLSRLLYIDSIPRMILLAPDGRVLFNGHPMADELDAALARLVEN
jgi:thiol-disulfide isomerase/thioredoxin